MTFDRRDFLKFAAGGAIGTLFTPLPWKLLDDISIWSQNWSWIPRVPKGNFHTKNTVIKLGGSAYGAKVNFVGKNPITVAGNKEHPLSYGGVDPVGINAIALMYSPSRVTTPLKKDTKGNLTKISWDDALNILIEKLEGASKKHNNILFVSGDDTSSANEIFSALLTKLNSTLYFYAPSDRHKYFVAWNKILNGWGEIGFDIENSDYLLVLGCDIFDNWSTYVRNQMAFGNNNIEVDYVGPILNHTSVVAKHALIISEKDLYKFLFAVVNVIINHLDNVSSITGIEDFLGSVTFNYNPQKIAKEIGCDVSDIKNFAKRLLMAKRPLIIAGSTIDGGGPTKNILAALIVNTLLDRINKKGGITCIPNPPKILNNALSHQEILNNDLIKFIMKQNTKNIDVAFFYETNPFFELPIIARKKLQEIGFKVCISPIMTESCYECDLIIPSPYFLERLDDCFTPFGSGAANYSVANLLIENKNPSIPDFFINLANKLKIDLGIDSFENLIKTKSEYFGEKYDSLIQGKCWIDYTFETPYSVKIWNRKIENIFNENGLKLQSDEVEITCIIKRKVGTSLTGILPFSNNVIYEDELPDKYMYAHIHPATLEKFHLKENEKILISTNSGQIKAYVKEDNGIVRDSIGILYGMGRKIKDKFNEGKGENVVDILELNREDTLNNFYWSNARAKLQKI